VVEAIVEHHAHLERSGELTRRRLARVRREIEALALSEVSARFAHLSGDVRLDALAAGVLAGETDPFAAADTLVEHL
jgi:LAO/AO transport system kinase